MVSTIRSYVLLVSLCVSSAARFRRALVEFEEGGPCDDGIFLNESSINATLLSLKEHDDLATHDHDGDQKLTKEELLQVFPVYDGVLKFVMECTDTDNDGSLDLDEWAALSNVSNQLCRESRIEQALSNWTFPNADANNDSCATVEEVATLQNALAGIPGESASSALVELARQSFACNGFAADACVNETAYQRFNYMTDGVGECWMAAQMQYKKDIEQLAKSRSRQAGAGDKLVTRTLVGELRMGRPFLVESWLPTMLSPVPKPVPVALSSYTV